MSEKIKKTEAEWRAQLTPAQFEVTRNKGTERAFTGAYHATKDPGTYRCVCCGEALFESEDKFDSGCGWPSFDQPIDKERIGYHEDRTHGMRRVEVTCARCDAHLGHVVPDGPPETTGTRYCINSLSLDLEAKEEGEG